MLKKVDFDKSIKEKLAAPIPRELIKERNGGRQTLSYISGSTAIDMLNDIFGYAWDWKVEKYWVAPCEPKYNKNDQMHEHPIAQGPVCHVLGTLTIHLQDNKGNDVVISKSGFGSKMVVGGQSDQKDNFKAAGTDALKKAASLVGIAAQLYRDEDEQNYFDALNEEVDDPWADDAVYEAHADERAYLKNLMENQDITTDDLNQAVATWSKDSFDDIQDLAPEEFTAFVNYLKEEEAKSNEEEA
jgi:recombination DNA repair RAD52 pathway protein